MKIFGQEMRIIEKDKKYNFCHKETHFSFFVLLFLSEYLWVKLFNRKIPIFFLKYYLKLGVTLKNIDMLKCNLHGYHKKTVFKLNSLLTFKYEPFN